MIRKIIAGTFLIYLSIWFGISSFMKEKIKESLENNENLLASYSQINSSGFPNKWEFEILDPVFITKDEYITFSSSYITFSITSFFKSFDISMGKNSILKLSQDDGSETSLDISFDKNPHMILNIKNIMFSGDSMDNLSNLYITPFNLIAKNDDKDVLAVDLESASIEAVKHDKEYEKPFRIVLNTIYEGNEDILGFAKLTTNIDTLIDLRTQLPDNKLILSKLKPNKFDISIDDEAKLVLSGEMDFKADKLPEGELILDLENYPKLVNALWNDYFDLTTIDIKAMISKASGENGDTNVRLPLAFSDRGLKIGIVLWSDLKEE